VARIRAVTMKDIAERAGVSAMTVSAVLSGKSKNVFVSETTRQRVSGLAQELGYRPNQMARALVTGRTHAIEFWVPDVKNPYFNWIYYATRRSLAERDLHLLLLEVRGRSPAQPLPLWSADGILVCNWVWGDQALDALLEANRPAYPPMVSMGAYHSRQGDFVGVDLYPAAVSATQHLLAVGCHRIAYLMNDGNNFEEETRARAYTAVLREAGHRPEYIVVPRGLRADTREALREYVRANGPPEGIFCHNDVMAIGAYRALRDLGLSIPADVALVGCDGIEDGEYLDCPLTTIVQPVEAMCEQACGYLQARLDDPSRPAQQTVLDCQLVVRESSRR
jgi:LacI family transcriptional regulator, galactose operon repressor